MLKVFISYPTKDGIDEARQARNLFKQAGHSPCMWEHDRTAGALTWREISDCIVSDTDLVFYICTASSCSSYGQGQEAGYALNNRVKVLVVRLGDAQVPVELTARTYETFERNQFAEKCKALADKLPTIVRKIQELDAGGSARQEPSRIAERLEHIQELNARTAQLDSKRVLECKETVWSSYEAATLPRQVASLSQELNPEALRFHRIELWARIKLKEFNDPSFWWGSYFSDVGRAIASGERNYLQKAIGQQVSEDTVTISHSNPQFSVLTERIQVLAQGNLAPDTLLAPVHLEVPFIKFYRDHLDWSAERPRLTVRDTQLRVFWSHKYAPLDRFIIFNSKAGTWRVIPDQETGRAITIALGQSKLYPDEVEHGVETTVRYDVTDPSSFRVICLSS